MRRGALSLFSGFGLRASGLALSTLLCKRSLHDSSPNVFIRPEAGRSRGAERSAALRRRLASGAIYPAARAASRRPG